MPERESGNGLSITRGTLDPGLGEVNAGNHGVRNQPLAVGSWQLAARSAGSCSLDPAQLTVRRPGPVLWTPQVAVRRPGPVLRQPAAGSRQSVVCRPGPVLWTRAREQSLSEPSSRRAIIGNSRLKPAAAPDVTGPLARAPALGGTETRAAVGERQRWVDGRQQHS